MNFSNMSNLMISPDGSPVGIKAQILIESFVTQIDKKIVLAVLLVFTGYMFYSIILPRAKIGLTVLCESFPYPNLSVIIGGVSSVIDWLISLAETLALGGACFIFGIAYFQGVIGRGSLVWAGSLLFILLLSLLAELVGFIVKKKYKKVVSDTKKIIKTVEVSEDA